MSYVTGNTIRLLREKQGLTQKQLADQINVSDKTVSKWETDRGLPDSTILTELAGALKVSVAELLTGKWEENQNRSSNMQKLTFYVCPVCGNIIQSVGKGSFSCCGIQLPPLEAEETDGSPDQSHMIQVETIDNEYYISLAHPMTKTHSLSFIAYVTSGRAEIVKLYPEQDPEARFAKRGRGRIYAYCSHHGLFQIRV